MTKRLRASISMAMVGTIAGACGALLGAGVAWGTLNSRVERLETEFSGQRPILLNIDRSMSSVEQCIRDMDRRIGRIENREELRYGAE